MPPKDLDTGAAYLHAGAERLQSNGALSGEEQGTLLSIAAQGERREPDNPFWPLAAFVFHEGRGTEARLAFRRASGCIRYYDHQRPQIERDLRRVSQGDRVRAWAYAAVADDRSSAMVRQIHDIALRVFRGERSERKRIDFAYEAIRNGALIRDGSERLDLGMIGIDLIERATYPPDLAAPGKGSFARRLWIAKTTLTATLRAEGRARAASFCDEQFRKNDSWQAFRDVVDTQERLHVYSIMAVLVDAIPGALLVAALLGGLIWLFSRRIAAVASKSDRFRGWELGAYCFTILVAGSALGYPTIALAAGACTLVPALGPERPRRYDGGILGPLHVLVVGLLVIGLGGSDLARRRGAQSSGTGLAPRGSRWRLARCVRSMDGSGLGRFRGVGACAARLVARAPLSDPRRRRAHLPRPGARPRERGARACDRPPRPSLSRLIAGSAIPSPRSWKTSRNAYSPDGLARD